MEQEKLIELVRRSKEGDEAAREALVLAAQNRVYYHCKKMMKNEEDAQDAAQDVLLAMLTGLDKLKEPAAFWGWVNGITANRCKHLLSAPHKEWQIPEDEEGNSMLESMENLDETLLPDRALDNEETRRMILDLVDKLPPEQRMSVLFYYYDEMSVKQIAEAMDTSEGTVKSRLNYARKSIKTGVEEYARKGVKLYSASPILLLVYFLRQEAASTALDPAAAAAIAGQVLHQAGSAGASAASGAGTAGTSPGGGASAAVKTAGAAAKSGVPTKVVAGLVAGALAVGGLGGAGITSMVYRNQAPESAPIVEESQPPADEEPVWTAVFAGGNTVGLLGEDGSLWIWGWDHQNVDDLEKNAFSREVMENVQSADFSSLSSAAIKDDGSLWMWGNNFRLMVGNGTDENVSQPVKVLEDVAQVSCGEFITAAVKNDGTLWTWGSFDSDYLLGTDATTSSSVPIQIMDGVAQVSCGSWHAAAVKTDGSLWTWGVNTHGELADGTDEDAPVPIHVMDGVAQVSCGAWITAVLKTDGSLWMCGSNTWGQMGVGTTEFGSPLVKVMDGVAQVSCGAETVSALKTDGTVWAWGDNRNGGVGLDEGIDYAAEPVQIMDGAEYIASGYAFTAVRKTDGTVWAWGNNLGGQLGDGTTVTSQVPVRVVFSPDGIPPAGAAGAGGADS